MDPSTNASAPTPQAPMSAVQPMYTMQEEQQQSNPQTAPQYQALQQYHAAQQLTRHLEQQYRFQAAQQFNFQAAQQHSHPAVQQYNHQAVQQYNHQAAQQYTPQAVFGYAPMHPGQQMNFNQPAVSQQAYAQHTQQFFSPVPVGYYPTSAPRHVHDVFCNGPTISPRRLNNVCGSNDSVTPEDPVSELGQASGSVSSPQDHSPPSDINSIVSKILEEKEKEKLKREKQGTSDEGKEEVVQHTCEKPHAVSPGSRSGVVEEQVVVTNVSDDSDKKYGGCVLCQARGRPEVEFMDHCLRNKDGVAVCPFLRRNVCCHCGDTDDAAHNEFFCPKQAKKRMLFAPRPDVKLVNKCRKMK